MMYQCQHCPYTTDRVYNYNRHISSNHVEPVKATASHLESDECECPDCGKTLKSRNLEAHKTLCKKVMYEHQCKSCNRKFSSKTAMYNHVHVCKKKDVPVPSTSAAPAASIVGDSNTVYNGCNVTNNDNSVTNNTTNVYQLLVYPANEKESQNFDFVSDHIKDHTMKQLINQKPVYSFEDFMKKIFSNPVNKIVKKTNTNSKFCKVHMGDEEWHTKIDIDVMPVILFHMTTAALYRIAEFKKSPLHRGMADVLDKFIKYVEEINQTDMSEKEFENAVDRLKSILVTISELEKSSA